MSAEILLYFCIRMRFLCSGAFNGPCSVCVSKNFLKVHFPTCKFPLGERIANTHKIFEDFFQNEENSWLFLRNCCVLSITEGVTCAWFAALAATGNCLNLKINVIYINLRKTVSFPSRGMIHRVLPRQERGSGKAPSLRREGSLVILKRRKLEKMP